MQKAPIGRLPKGFPVVEPPHSNCATAYAYLPSRQAVSPASISWAAERVDEFGLGVARECRRDYAVDAGRVGRLLYANLYREFRR